jgi:hypothetical protein
VTVLLDRTGDVTRDVRVEAELRAEGATVRWCETDPRPLWDRALEALAAPGAGPVALTLRGWHPESTRWLRDAMVAFEAPAVAVVFGEAMRRNAGVEPLVLHDARTGRLTSTPIARSVDYLVLRPEAAAALAAARAHGHLGDQAVVLALVDELLRTGRLVGRRNVEGLEPLSGNWPTGAQRDRVKLALWGARIGQGSAPRPLVMAELATVTAGGVAKGALRRGRGKGAAALGPRQVAGALIGGFRAGRHATLSASERAGRSNGAASRD